MAVLQVLVPRRKFSKRKYASREFGGAKALAGACSEKACAEKCSPKANVRCLAGPSNIYAFVYREIYCYKQTMGKWRFRRTTIITTAMLAFLVGLGLARLISLDSSWVWLALIGNIIAIHHRRILPLTLVLLALSIGWWRGSVIMQQLAVYKPLYNQKVVVSGIADNDAVYGDKSQITFDLSDVKVIKPAQTNLLGKIKIAGFGVNMVYRGDRVQVEGKLYKTRGSRQASISFADIAVQGHSSSRIDSVRRNFSAGMESALPEPLASFALGLLIGQRSTIPDSVNTRLSMVGLTHLVAVSGYNLTILAIATRRLVGKRSKYQSTMFSLLLIGLFLLVTGLSASIVRAAIVSVLSLGAWYYGRNIKPILLISFTAALTAGWNPLYLWSDIGWYLSFLAFFGVLVIAPLLAKRLYPNKAPRPLTMLLLESLSAQLMTAPLIMYIFGQISVVGILANLLVVPFVPLAMLVSLIAGISGMFLPSVAGWLAWPARLLLTYMLDIATALSRVSHALIARSLRVQEMLVIYSIIVLLCLILWHKIAKNSKITEYKDA